MMSKAMFIGGTQHGLEVDLPSHHPPYVKMHNLDQQKSYEIGQTVMAYETYKYAGTTLDGKEFYSLSSSDHKIQHTAYGNPYMGQLPSWAMGYKNHPNDGSKYTMNYINWLQDQPISPAVPKKEQPIKFEMDPKPIKKILDPEPVQTEEISPLEDWEQELLELDELDDDLEPKKRPAKAKTGIKFEVVAHNVPPETVAAMTGKLLETPVEAPEEPDDDDPDVVQSKADKAAAEAKKLNSMVSSYAKQNAIYNSGYDYIQPGAIYQHEYDPWTGQYHKNDW